MSLEILTVKMAEELLERIDRLVRDGYYPSRSELIRTAIRDLIIEELGSYGVYKKTQNVEIQSLAPNYVV